MCKILTKECTGVASMKYKQYVHYIEIIFQKL